MISDPNGPSPVFIIGRHRSGTTWLTNIIGSHPAVFTPSHSAHKGQHESAFFSLLVPYCRGGRDETDRIAIRAIFEKSDYWHLLFPKQAPELDIESLGVARYFSYAMDEATRQRACSFWVEKTPTHTLLLDDILKSYPEAKVVAITRDPLDTVKSNVYKFGNPDSLKDWVKAAIWGEIYNKIINGRQADIFVTSYDALSSDYDEECRRVFEYIGIASDGEMTSEWSPDSSFKGGSPEVALKFKLVVYVMQAMFRLVPSRLCQKFGKWWVSRRKPNLPQWFFRIYKGR